MRAQLSQTFQKADNNSRSSKITSSLNNSSKSRSNDIQIFEQNDIDSNIKIIENKIVDADKYILTIKDSVSSRIGKRVL
jgi:hypothetical protein